METETDPATRRALVSERVEGSFATAFRQTVLSRYEQRAYALRAEGATLTAERLSDIWFEENLKYYGDALRLPEGYRLGWSYIPHFIHTRFYTYAYVFAHLTTLALYAQFREEGAAVRRPLPRVPGGGRVGAAGGAARPASAWTWRTRTCGSPGSARWSGWWRWRRRAERPPPRPRPGSSYFFEAFLEALSGFSAFWTCSGSSPIG